MVLIAALFRQDDKSIWRSWGLPDLSPADSGAVTVFVTVTQLTKYLQGGLAPLLFKLELDPIPVLADFDLSEIPVVLDCAEGSVGVPASEPIEKPTIRASCEELKEYAQSHDISPDRGSWLLAVRENVEMEVLERNRNIVHASAGSSAF